MFGDRISRGARSRAAFVVLGVAMLLLGPGIAASASTGKAVHSQKKAITCTAPPTVTIGTSGTPNVAVNNDLGYTAFVGPLERLCHTVVNVEYFSSSTVVFAALLGGSVQYITGSLNTQLAAIQQGTASNVVSLMALTQGGGALVTAPIKYKSYGIGIKSLSKYANLTWGVTSLGGAVAIYINEALKSDGVDPTTISRVVVGNGALAALVSGKVGLVVSSAATMEPAIVNGSSFYVWYAAGLQAYRLTGFLPSSALMTLNSTISQYRELTQQITDVNLKNLLFLQKNSFHPQTVYNATVPSFQALTPYSTFASYWPISRAIGAPLTGLLTQKGLQRLANTDYNNQVITSPVTAPKSAVNSSFIDEAYKSMGLKVPTSQVNPKYLYLLGDKWTGLKAS